jgi:hypothetical protein
LIIYIFFCKCKDEPLYRYLADKSKGTIEVHENLEKLPALNDLNACKQTFIIFDDFISDLKKHPKISEYFIRGRKKSSFYNVLKSVLLQNSEDF